jgi:ABC-type antimicrobial peptide transport system permease subunit
VRFVPHADRLKFTFFGTTQWLERKTLELAAPPREIGVRIAVGAQPSDILKLVTEQGVKIVGLGLLVGLMAALILARFVESLLYGVTTTDPLSVGAAVFMLACLLPVSAQGDSI